MRLTIYKYKGNLRKIKKTMPLTSSDYYEFTNIYLKNGSSVTNPVIEVKEPENINMYEYNYGYIPEWDRMYFVEVDSICNGLWTLRLHIDVLNTYQNIIQTTPMVIGRCMTYNYKITDDLVTTLTGNDITITNLSFETQGNLKNFSFGVQYESDINICLTAINDNGKQIIYTDSQSNPHREYEVTPPIPSMSVYKTFENGFGLYSYYYVLSVEDIDGLRNIYQESKASFIKSLIAYPFRLVSRGTGVQLKLGNESITGTNFKLFDASNLDFKILLDYTFPLITSYLDYEPYTEWELFIPFVGWKKFNISELQFKRILVAYKFNYDDGSADVFVINYTDNYVIFTQRVQVGVKIGISRSNLEELNAQKISNAINTTLGVVSSAVTTAFGVISANPVAVVGGVLGATGSITKGIQTNMNMFERGNAVVTDAVCGNINGKQVFLKKVSKRTYNVNSEMGYPFKQIDTISNLPSGYVKIDECPSLELYNGEVCATKEEVDEVIRLLKEGVIK